MISGIGHPLHRIVRAVAAGVKGGLKVDSLNRGVIKPEADDPADFMFIDAALDGGNENHGTADLRQTVERASFSAEYRARRE